MKPWLGFPKSRLPVVYWGPFHHTLIRHIGDSNRGKSTQMVEEKHDPSAWLTRVEDIQDIPTPACELLEKYAGVPSDEVVPHTLRLV
jgi:hypothetical protein